MSNASRLGALVGVLLLSLCWAPAAQQADKRLNAWFDGVERYPAQLHEMERGEYLDMKRKEIARQQAPGPAATAK